MRALVVSAGVAVLLVLVWKGVPFGVQGRSGLETAVEQSYRLDHEQGHNAEPEQVRCELSPFDPELVSRSQSIGANGPFDDCTVAFSDGTRATSCWSGAKGAYRVVWTPEPDETAKSEPACGSLLFRPVIANWSTASGALDPGAPNAGSLEFSGP
jgi:hypothetical protein